MIYNSIFFKQLLADPTGDIPYPPPPGHLIVIHRGVQLNIAQNAMQALKDGLLVGPFISEFCLMVTDKCLSMNWNVLHKCVSSGGPHQSKSGAAHSGCTGNSITP